MSDQKKKSILFYIEQLERFRYLNMEERGEMITAIFDYAKDGIITTFEDRAMTILFDTFRNEMDLDAIKYERICEANRINGKKGGRPVPTNRTKPDGSSENRIKPDGSSENRTKPDGSSENRTKPKKPQIPNTKYQTPNTENQTPNTKHLTPNTKYQTPNTENQIPNTKHDIPKQESSAPDGLREAPVPKDAEDTGDMRNTEAPEAASDTKRLRAEQVRKQWKEIEWGDTQ